jgi:murein DD-endopeptidase MepM/ murein hydrolase activator NlpD
VLAATAGRIEIDTSQAWAGRWLVKVVTAPTSLATWFAHMQKLDVTAGQVVRPGEQIGEVGDLGNATGCHLHFEVHLKNGSIYGPDNTNPSPWLASNAN